MSERGTINIDRGLFGHPVFADEPLTEREAWMWLIAEAAFKPYRKRVGARIIDFKRGELAHSSRFMARAWKWSEVSVRRFLAKLAAVPEGAMITLRYDAGLTHVTICNYDGYQDEVENHDAGVTQTRRDSRDRGESRAREAPSTISPEAFALADEFLTAVGVDPKNPELSGLAGGPYIAQMWLARGFERALILATAANIAARYGPSKPWNYYTRCIETAHRERPAPGQRSMPLFQAVDGGRHAADRQSSRGAAPPGESFSARALRLARRAGGAARDP